MEAVLLVLGLVIGGAAAWLIAIFKSRSEKGISPAEIEAKYVPKELYAKLEGESIQQKAKIESQQGELIELHKTIAAGEKEADNLREKLASGKQDLETVQERLRNEFKVLAGSILEEKSEKFTTLNQKNIADILNPLKEKIDEFKKKVESTYDAEIRDTTKLKAEIEKLLTLNKQVSDDANRLADALKNETKVQGNWGEAQLKRILDKVGLTEGVHYRMQAEYRDEDGTVKIPDCVVDLPDNRHLVIDAKVSLVAYERYFAARNEDERNASIAAHLQSVISHITELARKDYHALYEINSPDYVLMFMPIESALAMAVNAKPDIFEFASGKNVVLLTSSTLIATLRTISYIWKQENQKRNVWEIAKQSGALYDKFVGFVKDLETIGTKLDGAKEAYEDAYKKLYKPTKSGGSAATTIVGKIEDLKRLGAQVKATLPQELIDKSAETEEAEGEVV